MSDKIESKKKCKKYIEKCIEEYIETHLVELKRKFINIDGLVSKEEYDEKCQAFDEKKEQVEQLEQNLAACEKEKQNIEKRLKEKTKECDERSSNYNELKMQQKELKQELDVCREEKEKAEKALEAGKKTLEDAAEIKKQLADYEKCYGEIEKIYQEYQTLSDDVRTEIKGLFGRANTPISFFCCALQEARLDKFWDYICNKINNRQLEQTQVQCLCRIFDFCFDRVNDSQQYPLYKRLDIQRNIPFDSRWMRKTSDSSQLGIVQAVELSGYSHAVSGKIVKYSLVTVGKGEQ